MEEKNLWDNIAKTYQKTADNCILLEPFIINLCGNVSGFKILDVGCGEGCISKKLAEKDAKVLGIDFSPNMIKKASLNLDCNLQLEYKVADATQLDKIPNETFDLVISNLVYVVMKDFNNVINSFKETNRILKPEGRFIFSIAHPCFDSKEIKGNKIVVSNNKSYFNFDEKYEVSLIRNGQKTASFFYYHRRHRSWRYPVHQPLLLFYP